MGQIVAPFHPATLARSANVAEQSPTRLAVSSGKAPSALGRLTHIEGLRAYLAFWVLICHVLWTSGYTEDLLSGLPRLLVHGDSAVDLFIIISGFVVFFLLDKQQETYGQFIVRRFFRLFPLFIVLFFLAIPLSRVTWWNATHSSLYWEPGQLAYVTALVPSWWHNLYWHIPLHLLMLHGVVPDALIRDSPSAFLVAAWSVSLEWQFYLVAPLAYAWAVSSRPFRRLRLCLACMLLFLAARKLFPTMNHGAALPFHLEFFFLGCASYFLYKRNLEKPHCDTWFPVACSIALFFLFMGGKSQLIVPVALWIAFLGLVLEHPSSFCSRFLSPLFTNRLCQFLGRISYSVYLVHMLPMVLMQRAIFKCLPQLSHIAHFWILFALTAATTIAASTCLYRLIEAPGIKLGRAIAVKLTQRNATRVLRVRPHCVVHPAGHSGQ